MFSMDLLHVTVLAAVLGLTSGAGLLPHDSVNAAVGDTVTFTTSLLPTQTPFSSIVWKFATKTIITAPDNTTAPEYGARITLFIATGSLELRNVTMSDSGEYNVTIIKADGAQLNGITTLEVWEIISDASVTSTTQLPAEGTSLNVTCDASGSVDVREWMRNGSPLHPSENIEFYHQKQILSFKALSRKDSGRFTCNIRNPVSHREATYYMVVTYGPENVAISGPKDVQEQTGFKLSCSAESLPAASFIWIKNGTTVADSSDFTKNRSDSSDSGEFICRATNDITMKTSERSHTLLITAPKDSLSAGAIAGITIACLVLVVGAAVGAVFIYKKYAGNHQKKKKSSVDRPTVSASTKTRNARNAPRASNRYTEENRENFYENVSTIYNRDL